MLNLRSVNKIVISQRKTGEDKYLYQFNQNFQFSNRKIENCHIAAERVRTNIAQLVQGSLPNIMIIIITITIAIFETATDSKLKKNSPTPSPHFGP